MIDNRKKKILIVVKTYPMPSRKYKEIVCTAGVLEDGSWIRLYPINYRDKDDLEKYEKYQWIHVEIEKNKQDYRPESYKPIGDIILGGKVSTGNNRDWSERKKYVLAKETKTMCGLQKTLQKNISLAVVKPRKVINFYWEGVDRNWSSEQLASLNQFI